MRLKTGANRRLWEARERLGLTRAQVEKQTAENHFKVPEGTIFNIEKGVSKTPYARNIFALAEVYGIDPGELFADEEVSA